MTNFCRCYFLAKFNRMLSRSLLVGAISTVGLFAGLIPDISRSSNTLVFFAAAYAQQVSDQDIKNYAQAVLEAEPVRQAGLDKIKQLIGSEQVPPIACYQPESLNSLPEQARSIAQDSCTKYEGIVKKHFESFAQFNQITRNIQNDPSLKERVQAEMLRLQGNAGSQ